ncbi:MAG TPA: energy transducer TonB [Rhodocyclaceae bacterium]|nr:energy transducer TonB [Rhodocyclaceae bacterium]
MNAMTPADHPLKPQEQPGKRIAFVLAVVVHAVLLGFLIYGIRWQTHVQEAVEVDLVRSVPTVAETSRPAPQEEPAPPPKPEPKPEPKPQPKPEPKVEPPKPVAKPDIAIKDKEKAKPEKPKPEPQDEPKKSNLLDKFLNKDLSQASDRKFQDLLAKDQAQLKASQAAAANSKALASYTGLIAGKVRGKLHRPPDVTGNPEAVFDVVQLPSGEVLSAKLKKSSGNKLLDDAIERAIYSASPLPLPPRPDLFSRELELRFKPYAE